jgi:hypothetical protein
MRGGGPLPFLLGRLNLTGFEIEPDQVIAILTRRK